MPVLRPRYLRVVVAAVLFTIVLFYSFLSGHIEETPVTWDIPTRLTSSSTSSYLEPSSASSSSSSSSQIAVPQSTTLAKLVSDVVKAIESSPAKQQRPPKFHLPNVPPHGVPLDTGTDLEPGECLHYERLQDKKQAPLSEGHRKFPYSRPAPDCRTFTSPPLEKLLERMKDVIKDPDLYRLFENSYPNTLDTTIKWRGFANSTSTSNSTVTDEELAFVITGDINAMWLRDSASQIYSYLPLLEASTDPDSLASLWRGVINVHARYIIISPYCHSFQPPPESGIISQVNGAFHQNNPRPGYDPQLVFDCKWELDSLASFLQISSAYYKKTGDAKFFQKHHWLEAVQAAVDASGAMRLGTYAPDGHVEHSAWTFTGYTNRGSETLTNDGLGNPTKANGMVRSAFRPSDDACIFQLLVPANMMFAKYLEEASIISALFPNNPKAENLTTTMREFALGIRTGIDNDAIIHHKTYGDIFAYEIDGFGGSNLMDDANIPSLLAMPLWNYTSSDFKLPEGAKEKDYAKIYSNTRNFVLGDDNPYFAKGPILSAVGGPHLGPGKGWPMAAIVRAMTAFSDLLGTTDGDTRKEEVKEQLKMLLDSTGGTGVVHESVNAWDGLDWTRAWFGWANGLLGELILKIEEEDQKAGGSDGGFLGESWQ